MGANPGWLIVSVQRPLPAAAAALLGGQDFEAGRPPAREDGLDEFFRQVLAAHLGSQTVVVVGDGNELDREGLTVGLTLRVRRTCKLDRRSEGLITRSVMATVASAACTRRWSGRRSRAGPGRRR